MPSPSQLPLEARRISWSRLWELLLAEPPSDALEPRKTEPGSEVAEIEQATARAPPERGGKGCCKNEEP